LSATTGGQPGYSRVNFVLQTFRGRPELLKRRSVFPFDSALLVSFAIPPKLLFRERARSVWAC
jgi:hypothetical protein